MWIKQGSRGGNYPALVFTFPLSAAGEFSTISYMMGGRPGGVPRRENPRPQVGSFRFKTTSSSSAMVSWIGVHFYRGQPDVRLRLGRYQAGGLLGPAGTI